MTYGSCDILKSINLFCLDLIIRILIPKYLNGKNTGLPLNRIFGGMFVQ